MNAEDKLDLLLERMAQVQATVEALLTYISLMEPPYNEHFPNTPAGRMAWQLHCMNLSLLKTGVLGPELPFPGDIIPKKERVVAPVPGETPRHMIELNDAPRA